MLYPNSHKIALPALMENGFNYLPLFHYAVENKTNTENRCNYGYIYGFDYGNGYTSTATKNLTSDFCVETTCNFNRYSYCLNNPLKYVDPTGNRFVAFDDEWNFNITTGEKTWVSDKGRDYGWDYYNLIDNSGNNFGQYGFPIQNFSFNWSNIEGLISLAIKGSSFSTSGGFTSMEASLTGQFSSSVPYGELGRLGSFNNIDYVTSYNHKSLASGRVEYSPFNVGDMIGVGMAVKGLVTAGARMLGASMATGGARAFYSGAGTEARAIQEGFTTLSQTRAGKNLMKLTEGMPYNPGSQAYNWWGRLSATYAKGVPKGSQVNVFLNNPSPTGIWNTIEKPILQQNGILILYR